MGSKRLVPCASILTRGLPATRPWKHCLGESEAMVTDRLLSTRPNSENANARTHRRRTAPSPMLSAQTSTKMPSDMALTSARAEAAARRETTELRDAVRDANVEGLLQLLQKLMGLQASSTVQNGSNTGIEATRAWAAAAHRCVELSRLGTVDTAEIWARLLVAFAMARRADRALLVEAEHALCGEAGLLASADLRALSDIVVACDAIMAPCSSTLLFAVAARIKATSQNCLVDLPGQLGVANIALLAGAFARIGLRQEEVVSLVRQTLKDQNDAAVDIGSQGQDALVRQRPIAELAFFSHVFDLHRESIDLTRPWLLQHAVAASRSCSLGNLTKLLPFLAAVSSTTETAEADAAAAIRHAVDVRLPILLAMDAVTPAQDAMVNTIQELEADVSADAAAPRLLEALAVANERDIGLILGLATRCLRQAPHLGLSEILNIADALAKLRVRHERLLIELADTLCVRHQRAIGTQDMLVALRAWKTLRVPHAGLLEAARHFFINNGTAMGDASHEVQLLSDFASVEPPGCHDWPRNA